MDVLQKRSFPIYSVGVRNGSASSDTDLSNMFSLSRMTNASTVMLEENGGQASSLRFYGSSFITDEVGEVLSQADREGDCVIMQGFDLDEIRKARLEWGLFRDRRPECYGIISGR